MEYMDITPPRQRQVYTVQYCDEDLIPNATYPAPEWNFVTFANAKCKKGEYLVKANTLYEVSYIEFDGLTGQQNARILPVDPTCEEGDLICVANKEVVYICYKDEYNKIVLQRATFLTLLKLVMDLKSELAAVKQLIIAT